MAKNQPSAAPKREPDKTRWHISHTPISKLMDHGTPWDFRCVFFILWEARYGRPYPISSLDREMVAARALARFADEQQIPYTTAIQIYLDLPDLWFKQNGHALTMVTTAFTRMVARLPKRQTATSVAGQQREQSEELRVSKLTVFFPDCPSVQRAVECGLIQRHNVEALSWGQVTSVLEQTHDVPDGRFCNGWGQLWHFDEHGFVAYCNERCEHCAANLRRIAEMGNPQNGS